MSEITIFLLYLVAAAAFGATRLSRFASRARILLSVACVAVAGGISLHSISLYGAVFTAGGMNLSLANAASMIGLELALISLFAALERSLRGISAGLLVLGAFAAMTTVGDSPAANMVTLDWRVRAHVLISLMSYGLITVGAIVAIYALVQEKRLRSGQLSSVNRIFAPLETTEKLLFGISSAGFAGLAMAILSGLTFVDNLFAQHLVHKTTFSILALLVFGTLIAGRHFAGWRGARAIKLYLGGFALLCLAYFGTRIILEQVLQRSWS